MWSGTVLDRERERERAVCERETCERWMELVFFSSVNRGCGVGGEGAFVFPFNAKIKFRLRRCCDSVCSYVVCFDDERWTWEGNDEEASWRVGR